MIEYYRDPEEGAKVKKLNLRAEYEAQEYHPPFQIIVCKDETYGQYYKVQDSYGKIICDTWRQGVDAERIVEALNFFYSVKKVSLLEMMKDYLKKFGAPDELI